MCGFEMSVSTNANRQCITPTKCQLHTQKFAACLFAIYYQFDEQICVLKCNLELIKMRSFVVDELSFIIE